MSLGQDASSNKSDQREFRREREVQGEFNFERSRKMACIAKARLPAVVELKPKPGKKSPKNPPTVAAKAMRSVLVCLDDHARNNPTCFPSVDTIAKKINYHRVSVTRTLNALEQEYLIHRKFRWKHGHQISTEYRIIFSNLEALWPDADGATATKPDQHSVEPEQHDVEPEQHDVEPEQHAAPPLNHHSKRTSNRHPHQPPDLAAVEQGWREVAAVLSAEGVGKTNAAIVAARNAGCTPELILRIVDDYRSHRGWWGPGALKDRVAGARPDQDPADLRLWPRPSESARQAESAEKRAAEARTHREEAAKRAAQQECNRQKMGLLFSRFDDAAIEAAIESAFAGQESNLIAARRSWRASGRNGLAAGLFSVAIAKSLIETGMPAV